MYLQFLVKINIYWDLSTFRSRCFAGSHNYYLKFKVKNSL